jgi:hypothetical protein
MNIWEQLVKTALLGTEKGSLSEETQRKLLEKGIGLNVSPEQQLLEGLTYVHQLKRAAQKLSSYDGDLTEQAQADQNYCSPKSMRILAEILEGPYEKALKEFVWYARKSDKTLTPEVLPELFYRSVSDKLVWEFIQPLIGNRGEWLLSLNPDWQVLSHNKAVDFWQHASQQERLAILRFLRATDPVQAIAVLESTWAKDSHTDRKAFLEVLERNLSKSDESFLEKSLKDSRKEIREKASELLLKIQDSAYCKRMIKRAQEWIALTKDGGIEVEIPENPDDQTRVDCLIPKRQTGTEWRAKSLWVKYLLLLPPDTWEQQFGKSPKDCFQVFYQTYRWRHVLMGALLRATMMHKDEKWMQAILEFWKENESEQYWNNHLGKQFIESLPNSIFNNFVIEHMGRGPNLIADDGLVSHMLCQGVQFWSDQLTLPLMSRFQRWMNTASAFDWSAIHYKKILEVAAYRASLKTYNQLKDGWPYRSNAWYRWEREVNRMLKVMAFRKEMIAALQA